MSQSPTLSGNKRAHSQGASSLLQLATIMHDEDVNDDGSIGVVGKKTKLEKPTSQMNKSIRSKQFYRLREALINAVKADDDHVLEVPLNPSKFFEKAIEVQGLTTVEANRLSEWAGKGFETWDPRDIRRNYENFFGKEYLQTEHRAGREICLYGAFLYTVLCAAYHAPQYQLEKLTKDEFDAELKLMFRHERLTDNRFVPKKSKMTGLDRQRLFLAWNIMRIMSKFISGRGNVDYLLFLVAIVDRSGKSYSKGAWTNMSFEAACRRLIIENEGASFQNTLLTIHDGNSITRTEESAGQSLEEENGDDDTHSDDAVAPGSHRHNHHHNHHHNSSRIFPAGNSSSITLNHGSNNNNHGSFARNALQNEIGAKPVLSHDSAMALSSDVLPPPLPSSNDPYLDNNNTITSASTLSPNKLPYYYPLKTSGALSSSAANSAAKSDKSPTSFPSTAKYSTYTSTNYHQNAPSNIHSSSALSGKPLITTTSTYNTANVTLNPSLSAFKSYTPANSHNNYYHHMASLPDTSTLQTIQGYRTYLQDFCRDKDKSRIVDELIPFFLDRQRLLQEIADLQRSLQQVHEQFYQLQQQHQSSSHNPQITPALCTKCQKDAAVVEDTPPINTESQTAQPAPSSSSSSSSSSISIYAPPPPEDPLDICLRLWAVTDTHMPVDIPLSAAPFLRLAQKIHLLRDDDVEKLLERDTDDSWVSTHMDIRRLYESIFTRTYILEEHRLGREITLFTCFLYMVICKIYHHSAFQSTKLDFTTFSYELRLMKMDKVLLQNPANLSSAMFASGGSSGGSSSSSSSSNLLSSLSTTAILPVVSVTSMEEIRLFQAMNIMRVLKKFLSGKPNCEYLLLLFSFTERTGVCYRKQHFNRASIHETLRRLIIERDGDATSFLYSNPSLLSTSSAHLGNNTQPSLLSHTTSGASSTSTNTNAQYLQGPYKPNALNSNPGGTASSLSLTTYANHHSAASSAPTSGLTSSYAAFANSSTSSSSSAAVAVAGKVTAGPSLIYPNGPPPHLLQQTSTNTKTTTNAANTATGSGGAGTSALAAYLAANPSYANSSATNTANTTNSTAASSATAATTSSNTATAIGNLHPSHYSPQHQQQAILSQKILSILNSTPIPPAKNNASASSSSNNSSGAVEQQTAVGANASQSFTTVKFARPLASSSSPVPSSSAPASNSNSNGAASLMAPQSALHQSLLQKRHLHLGSNNVSGENNTGIVNDVQALPTAAGTETLSSRIPTSTTNAAAESSVSNMPEEAELLLSLHSRVTQDVASARLQQQQHQSQLSQSQSSPESQK